MIIIYILYADDAGNTGTNYDDKYQPYFSLLGVIIDSDDWHIKNEKFNIGKVKIFEGFKNIEIHASDIFNGKVIDGINFRNLGKPFKNFEILEQIVDLILDLDLKIIRFVGNKRNLKNYCNNIFKSFVKVDPYLVAFIYVSHFFDYYVHALNKNGLIILDEQKSLTDNIFKILKVSQKCDDDDTIKIKNIIETSLFLDSCKSNFIQIADICNFYLNRHVTNLSLNKDSTTVQNTHCEKMYKKIESLFIEYDPMEYPEILSFVYKHFSVENEQPAY